MKRKHRGYGEICPICGFGIYEPQAIEHTEEGKAHAKCLNRPITDAERQDWGKRNPDQLKAICEEYPYLGQRRINAINSAILGVPGGEVLSDCTRITEIGRG